VRTIEPLGKSQSYCGGTGGSDRRHPEGGGGTRGKRIPIEEFARRELRNGKGVGLTSVKGGRQRETEKGKKRITSKRHKRKILKKKNFFSGIRENAKI